MPRSPTKKTIRRSRSASRKKRPSSSIARRPRRSRSPASARGARWAAALRAAHKGRKASFVYVTAEGERRTYVRVAAGGGTRYVRRDTRLSHPKYRSAVAPPQREIAEELFKSFLRKEVKNAADWMGDGPSPSVSETFTMPIAEPGQRAPPGKVLYDYNPITETFGGVTVTLRFTTWHDERTFGRRPSRVDSIHLTFAKTPEDKHIVPLKHTPLEDVDMSEIIKEFNLHQDAIDRVMHDAYATSPGRTRARSSAYRKYSIA